jgi:hypothetical protein
MNLPSSKAEVLRSCAALALHPATPANEADAAARAFFRVLKTLNVSAEDLLALKAGPPLAGHASPSRPFFSFGKYQGLPVEAIPTSYLTWVLDNLKPLSPQTVNEIERELDKRRGR